MTVDSDIGGPVFLMGETESTLLATIETISLSKDTNSSSWAGHRPTVSSRGSSLAIP